MKADRANQFPEQQEIGELRLNFIRLSAQAGAFRLTLIRMAPLLVGIAALWAVSERVINLDQLSDAAASGSADELGAAITQVLRTADFWLWFYLAFTVANTMFPQLPKKLRGGNRARLGISVAACLVVFWWLGGALDSSIALGMQSLIGNLALVTLQIIIMNVVCVIVLGAAESLIERFTGKSATFADGKMITMTREEARERMAAQAQTRRSARQIRPAQDSVESIRSVYDLKLPIPGPPGREPVSRSVVAVVNVQDGRAASIPDVSPASEPAKSPEMPPIQLDKPLREHSASAEASAPAPGRASNAGTRVSAGN